MKHIRLFVYFVFALFAFSLGVAGSFAASNSDDKISPFVLEQFDSGEERILVDVLVNEESRRKFDKIASKIDGRIVKEFYPEGFVVEMSKEEVFSLANRNYIEMVLPNLVVRPSLEDVVEIIDAVEVWDKEIDGVQLTGTGQTVCVIDSGVDFTHPDLADKGVFGQCNLDCTATRDCPLDCNTGDVLGHGTWVAGMVAASGGIEGVGKGADLIGVRVFEQGQGQAQLTVIERAISKCVELADEYDISAISISLGTEQNFANFCDGARPDISDAINNAVDNNIAVVASTGNDGDRNAIELPACMGNAIPVAATNKDDSVWGGSNFNDMVKLFAPGGDVRSTRRGGGYISDSGTSASTPVVAGSIAIINQYLELIGEPRSLHPKTDIEMEFFVNGDEVSGLSKQRWTRVNINNVILSLDKVAPEVELVSPTHMEQYVGEGQPPFNVEFVCSGTDWQLEDVTLRVKDVGRGDTYRETKEVSGESAEARFNVDLEIGVYEWNCKFKDKNRNFAWADEDYLVHVGPPFALAR
jgi:hypothetical protein